MGNKSRETPRVFAKCEMKAKFAKLLVLEDDVGKLDPQRFTRTAQRFPLIVNCDIIPKTAERIRKDLKGLLCKVAESRRQLQAPPKVHSDVTASVSKFFSSCRLESPDGILVPCNLEELLFLQLAILVGIASLQTQKI